MFSPNYCCCAIPLVNVGMYALLTEQFILCSVAGVLALATPTIVGAYVPTFTPYILSAVCFVVAGIQFVGFFGIYKEQIRTFRTYAYINAVAFALVFACAGALIGVSAAKHDSAVAECELAYFSGQSSSSSSSIGDVTVASEGKQVCSAIAWADVGIMGALWVILVVAQGYFIFMTKVYASDQKTDHQNYKSIYSANAEEFAMMERMSQFGPNPDAWDHRPSVESLRDDPNGTNTNMYEQPYGGRPGSHVGGGGLAHSRMYSESSLKNVQNYDQPPPGEPDYEYAQARQAQGGGGYGDQYEQQQQQQQYAGGGRQSRYVEHEEADDGRYGQQDGAQYRQRYGDEAEGKGEAYGQQQYGQQQYGGYR